MSRINADRFMRRFEQRFKSLAEQPMMGRSRDDLRSGLRSHPFESYLIFYKPLGDGIEVIRVLHAARDVDAMFH